MKTSQKSIVLILFAGILFSTGLAAQTGELKGMVYQSNWGPIYVGFWEDGFEAIVYESDGEVGYIDCQVEQTRLKGSWYQFNQDFEEVGSGDVNLEFSDDFQAFSGFWLDGYGSWGGEWEGTLDRFFNPDDEAYFENLVMVLGNLAD